MTWRGATVWSVLVRSSAAAAVVAACLAPAGAADPPASRAGGLVPTPRKTREELIREWDLNSDGTIDQGEAEVASSRMRRERAELRLNSGIDPVTGLPRGESPELLAPEEDVAEPIIPEDEPPAEPEPDVGDDERRLPGTRVPRRELPAVGRPAADARGTGQRPAADGAAKPGESRQPLTGGVRAGGMPARPGYGAGLPTPPLNAGLPIVPRTAPTTGADRPRAGLVPAPRQPARQPVRPAPSAPRPTGSRDMYDPY